MGKKKEDGRRKEVARVDCKKEGKKRIGGIGDRE